MNNDRGRAEPPLASGAPGPIWDPVVWYYRPTLTAAEDPLQRKPTHGLPDRPGALYTLEQNAIEHRWGGGGGGGGNMWSLCSIYMLWMSMRKLGGMMSNFRL